MRCQPNSFKAFAVLFLLFFPLYLLLNLNNRMNWGCTLGREHSAQWKEKPRLSSQRTRETVVGVGDDVRTAREMKFN